MRMAAAVDPQLGVAVDEACFVASVPVGLWLEQLVVNAYQDTSSVPGPSMLVSLPG